MSENIPTTTTYTINSVTPTTIATQDNNRLFISTQLGVGISDVDVFIRPYAAAQDSIKQGITVLTRRLSGNDNLYNPFWSTTFGPISPTTEFSAITNTGTVDIYVTEA